MSLLFSAGDAIMGDKVKRSAGPVTFFVKGLAMQEINEVVIFRNNEIVHRVEPGAEECEFHWTDESGPDEDLLWYYARFQTVYEHAAWSSPIWYTR